MAERDATTKAGQEFADGVAEPVIVFDRHLDVVAANRIAGAVSASLTVGTNLARFTFLNPHVEETALGWEVDARRTAAMLRDAVEHHEADERFRALLGELMTGSSTFATEWADGARGTVRPERRGVTTFDNPLVGQLVLQWEQLRREAAPDHVLVLWVPADATSARRLEQLRAMLTA